MLLSLGKLITGSAIAQIIGLLLLPIITRLFTPPEYGFFATLIALENVMRVLATGRYELAINIVDDIADYKNIVTLVFLLNSLICSILFFIILLFSAWLELVPILYIFLPLLIFLYATFEIIKYINLKHNHYSNIAYTQSIRALLIPISQIGLLPLLNGAAALVTGAMVGMILTNIFFLYKPIKMKSVKLSPDNIPLLSLKKQAIEFLNFPRYTLPQTLFQQISSKLILILFGIFLGPIVTSYYAIANRLVQVPSNIFLQTIRSFFFKHFGEKRSNDKQIINRTFFISITFSIPISLFLLYFGESIIIFILGEEWAFSNNYIPFLVFLFFFKLGAVTSNAFLISRFQQKYLFRLSAIFLLTQIIILLVLMPFVSPIILVAAYTFLACIMNYLVYLKASRIQIRECQAI